MNKNIKSKIYSIKKQQLPVTNSYIFEKSTMMILPMRSMILF